MDSRGWSKEGLNRELVRHNSRFYFRKPRTPGATDEVLLYQLPNSQSPSSGPYSPSGTIFRVNIVLPGTTGIPSYSNSEIVYRNGFPVAPLAFVLLLKLQAWSQNRAASEDRFQAQASVDHSDIESLFMCAMDSLGTTLHLSPAEAESFMDKSRTRVEEHVKEYPRCERYWVRLGFPPRTRAQRF